MILSSQEKQLRFAAIHLKLNEKNIYDKNFSAKVNY